MKRRLILRLALGVSLAVCHLFAGLPPKAAAGVPPPCQDIDGDGASDITDAIFFLQWLFLGGPKPTCARGNGQPAGLPTTGQTSCYDDEGLEIDCASATCPGQDGFHARGCSSAAFFVDNGDGTVTDSCTGLMWQKDTAGVAEDGDPADFEWCDALSYCEDLSFAGHDDWRLPNMRELQSILDYGRPDLIDPVFGAIADYYWSSTSYADGPDYVWYVDFYDGEVSNDDKTLEFYVRAVRGGSEAGGGPSLPACRDVDGDGSSDVTDVILFLQWLFLGGPKPTCPTGQPAGLPGTGQTLCYDDSGLAIDCASVTCPGQDAFHATGCSSAAFFADNGDGTVTDGCTGLMWQKDTADEDGQPAELEWCRALSYCENLSFAGHDDWRLPNVRELQSLADYGRFDPSIDPVFGAVPDFYWSSTTSYFFIDDPDDPEARDSAWGVYFYDGDVCPDFKGSGFYVRAVRGGP